MTAGLISCLILVYRFLALRLPVLPVEEHEETDDRAPGYGIAEEVPHA